MITTAALRLHVFGSTVEEKLHADVALISVSSSGMLSLIVCLTYWHMSLVLRGDVMLMMADIHRFWHLPVGQCV